MTKLYGAIEAGGTKIVCAVGSGPDNIEEVRLATTEPSQNLQQIASFFSRYKGRLASIGLASFGPIDLCLDSKTYGYITSTPQTGWRNTNIGGILEEKIQTSIAFTTDVNAAALGEQRWGAAQGLQDFIYLTIGTGIGGGIINNNQILQGVMNAEIGHIFIPKPSPYKQLTPPTKYSLEYWGVAAT